MALLFPTELVTTKSPSTENSNLISQKKIAETKNTFTYRTAISSKRYNDILGTLMGYNQGTPIVTEYYHQDIPMVNKQTSITDMSSTRHSVHSDYMLIHNYELRLNGPLDTQYDDESTEMTIDGTANVYPGFTPYIGDMFLYALPDKQLGLFQINNVERLSIQHGTTHTVHFHLHMFVEEQHEIVTKLNTSVSKEVWFDKQKYLSHNATLLETKDYQQLVTLKKKRKAMIAYYVDKFYSNDLKSVCRPDGIYDPYVVEYLMTKISFLDHHKTIEQIQYNLLDYNRSFWYLMSNSEYSDMSLLSKTGYLVLDKQQMWDVGITASLNKKLLTLTTQSNTHSNQSVIQSKENAPTYILSDAFYRNDSANLEDIEKLLVRGIRDRQTDIDKTIAYVNNIKDLDDITQFYYIPIYLFLVDIAINQIT